MPGAWPAWNLFGFFRRIGAGSVARLRAAAEEVWRQPTARRRLLIVVVALLVCSYALGVLAYVIATPEIGVQCAFTPVVNHFYPQFLDPPEPVQKPLRVGDTVVAVAGHSVKSWPQILRRVEHLPDEPAEAADEATLAEAVHRGATGPTHLLIDGRHVVRIDYHRSGDTDGMVRSVWLRDGQTPMDALAPRCYGCY